MTEQEMISKLLDTLEGLINHSDVKLSTEDLEDYAIVAVLAKRKYGRNDGGTAHRIIFDLGGVDVKKLKAAGLHGLNP